MYKLLLFTSILLLSFNPMNTKDIKGDTSMKIQNKILLCILETAKKQYLNEKSPFDKVKLKNIIINVEKTLGSKENYYFMSIEKINDVDNIYKVKLELTSYMNFIVDSNLIKMQEKFGDTLDFDTLFQEYYRIFFLKLSYESEFISLVDIDPIISYVKIIDNEVFLLKRSELDRDYFEKDKTRSFFINDNCR